MRWKDYEITAMKRALRLAARGRGSVEPNPMVGACVVRSGRIIVEGYHRAFGGPHAEVEALRKAGRRARGAEVFVTLEPCCHTGKTPPCTDALIAGGPSRVVVAMKDPFEKVRGRGVARLRRAGIRVAVGLLKKEATELNAPYVKLRTAGLPYFIAKYAMTLDGNIAAAAGDSKWVSGPRSRRRAHLLRGRVDAIIIGVETALRDDPLLTARHAGRRVPVRVVMDSRARLPFESRLVKTARRAPLLIATAESAPRRRVRALEERGAEVVTLPGRELVDVKALARLLGRREMTNVLVEGGSRVLGSFFGAGLIDEVVVFLAPKLLGSGLPPIRGWAAPGMTDAVILEDPTVRRTGGDVMITARVLRKE
ncbi:MAG: bifunctional diaminohydroxyphosphoribosylaminopyrimidine deaminase/5-amino-6-(5-phosphoribosylamino)uracil reductase RibD [Planctomycetota bacterium]|jgi:diaminohydroxyphosphoribosylaminopyrimidine deaminase/5-amino-6-(5-phosphoribosylamino)uracil reductase